MSEKIHLISITTGTDYSALDRSLSFCQWEEADELTLTLMLRIANRTSKGYLDGRSIKSFPSEDLNLIDNLWVYHSNGTLGFSVQKNIWKECGSPCIDYNDDKKEELRLQSLYRINWQEDVKKKDYHEINRAAWKEFGRKVNWQGGTAHQKWRYHKEIDYSNPQKYPGHLPVGKVYGFFRIGRIAYFPLCEWGSSLFSRNDLRFRA